MGQVAKDDRKTREEVLQNRHRPQKDHQIMSNVIPSTFDARTYQL